jgi:hypothetical protein
MSDMSRSKPWDINKYEAGPVAFCLFKVYSKADFTFGAVILFGAPGLIRVCSNAMHLSWRKFELLYLRGYDPRTYSIRANAGAVAQSLTSDHAVFVFQK